MIRSMCILALFAVLPACATEEKPLAESPPRTAPGVNNQSPFDAADSSGQHPLALYWKPKQNKPLITLMPANLSLLELGLEPVVPLSEQAAAEPRAGFTATINQYCPVMQKMKLGETTMVEHTAQFEGKTIGFCCEDCTAAWDAMSNDERRARVAAVLKKK